MTHTLTLVPVDRTPVFQTVSEPFLGLALFTTFALADETNDPMWLVRSQVRDEYDADLIPVSLDADVPAPHPDELAHPEPIR